MIASKTSQKSFTTAAVHAGEAQKINMDPILIQYTRHLLLSSITLMLVQKHFKEKKEVHLIFIRDLVIQP